jgi:hypothetical protein
MERERSGGTPNGHRDRSAFACVHIEIHGRFGQHRIGPAIHDIFVRRNTEPFQEVWRAVGNSHSDIELYERR